MYKIKKFLLKLKEDNVSEYAAECAYFTILSFIPFILFFITLIQFTFIDKSLIFQAIEEVFPKSTQEFLTGIINEIYSKSVGTVSITILVALWSASKGFYSLCKGFRCIYKVSEDKPNFIIRIEGLIYTLFFIISIIFIMILFVFGNRIHYFIVEKFFSFGIITSFILKIRGIFSVIALFFVFLILYRFVPRHEMTFKSQVPGAFFSSFAWIIFSYFFSLYIDRFNGFSNMYGSLTSIILVMIWVYVCMYIILIGAEINVAISKYRLKSNQTNTKNI